MTTFANLSDVVVAAAHVADLANAQISEKGWIQLGDIGPIKYDEVKRLHIDLDSVRGKGTRSCLQVIVTRFGLNDGARMGRYELVCYVG